MRLSKSETGKVVSTTLTRGNYTDAYTALDVVSNSTTVPTCLTFTNVGTDNDVLCVLGARMLVAVNAVPSGCTGFRLHLYNASPTAIADNAAYNLPAGDTGKYQGYIDFPAPIDLGDNIWAQGDSVNITIKLSGTSLYGILQTIGAYTPSASVVKTISLVVAGV